MLCELYQTQTHAHAHTHTRTHAHTNGPLSGTTRLSRYQKGKTYLDFTEARDSEWQWHPLGYMQVCTLLQLDNHASTPPLNFLQAGCPSCRPPNSVQALKTLEHKVTFAAPLTTGIFSGAEVFTGVSPVQSCTIQSSNT